ncbi:B3 domain-containing protein REM20-like [Chenopodium quinoa]|uniref:B3 domain-containing protein REM20-like n=1 Tax=Chenopodium quinoa TaxID=63459 RepID=UPI000B779720|nr:B3 domain-containing protein REM20-like [Chenopodium quinoa]
MARPAKRKRGRPRKYPVPQYPPEFFKIYLPEHNSKQLAIPPDFIRNFREKTPKKVILKNLKGEVWNVDLEKAGSKLLMKRGWEEFVTGNSVARGEFLIFTYKGNSVFIVKIFSISGCLKEDEPMGTNDQPHVTLKQEPNFDESYSHHTDVCSENTYLERSAKVEQMSQDSHKVMTRGVSEGNLDLKRIRFTSVNKGKIYELNIPAGIFTEYNIERPKPNRPEMVLLKYPRGISQTVKIWREHDCVQITTGWREFQLKNKLTEGDECDFEVSLGEGRKIKEIELLQIRRRTPITRMI